MAMALGKKAQSTQTKPGKAKGGTLDARFTRLLELRGDATVRQASAREQLLAKKRGMKATPTDTEARRLYWFLGAAWCCKSAAVASRA